MKNKKFPPPPQNWGLETHAGMAIRVIMSRLFSVLILKVNVFYPVIKSVTFFTPSSFYLSDSDNVYQADLTDELLYQYSTPVDKFLEILE